MLTISNGGVVNTNVDPSSATMSTASSALTGDRRRLGA
mgnify:CR=1 FL=1